MYGYVGLNPVSLMDPLGNRLHDPIQDKWAKVERMIMEALLHRLAQLPSSGGNLVGYAACAFKCEFMYQFQMMLIEEFTIAFEALFNLDFASSIIEGYAAGLAVVGLGICVATGGIVPAGEALLAVGTGMWGVSWMLSAAAKLIGPRGGDFWLKGSEIIDAAQALNRESRTNCKKACEEKWLHSSFMHKLICGTEPIRIDKADIQVSTYGTCALPAGLGLVVLLAYYLVAFWMRRRKPVNTYRKKLS